jgi:DNA-binding LytR/AlgR family response regulator
MIQAIAIDDELPALQIVEAFCKRSADVVHLQKMFNKPKEALQHVLAQPVDLLFLDINMPSLTGIDFYRSIAQPPMAIFTTAYSQYAVEGFELKAVDYLLKPFTYERFRQAVDRAAEWQRLLLMQKKEAAEPLLIRADYSFVKVSPSHILYIEGLGDYIKIYVQNSRPVITRITMKNMVDMLPKNGFARIHRSYIVSLNKITRVRNKTVVVEGKDLPLSSSYEEEFMMMYTGNKPL